MQELRRPCEGEVYKIIKLADKTFKIVYGFYSEGEREGGEPIPILPDFTKIPEYTQNGEPFVTRVQDACEFYEVVDSEPGDWCADCVHYKGDKEEIGICGCEKNLRQA